MFLLQKNVPNFKVIRMFAYYTTTLLLFIVHLIFREKERFSPEIKIILQKYGVLQIKSRQIRYQIWNYYSKMVEVMTFLCVLLHVECLPFLPSTTENNNLLVLSIAINVKLLIRYYARYVTKKGTMRYASPEKFYF